MKTLRRARPLLGTLVDITAMGEDPFVLAEALEAAFARVEEIHRKMSFHEPDSELAKLNREAYLHEVEVSIDLRAVMDAAEHVSMVSKGIFDTSIAPVLVARGLLPALTGSAPDSGTTWRDVVLLPHHRVLFTRPLQIDLGGIAKGYAVDAAAIVLRQAGVPVARVNAGGDMYLLGHWPDPVHSKHPIKKRKLIPLGRHSNIAVATSIAAARPAEGRLGNHVDPRDHLAIPKFAGVTILASSCMVADALTKVLLMGGPGALPCLESFEGQAVTVDWQGQILSSESLQSANAAGTTASARGKSCA